MSFSFADQTFRCEDVNKFNSSEEQCKFVMTNPACQDYEGFFNYLNLVYCHFNNKVPETIVLYGLWISFLFIALAVTTDNFFCPALHLMSKQLHLSENVAGVTLLAFGNGAADIFSSLAAASQDKPEIALSGLFGAGIFVSCVIAGSIMYCTPFELKQGPFLRDVIFYIVAAFWAFVLFYNGEIDLKNSIGFLALYVVYTLGIIISPWVSKLINQAYPRRLGYEQLDDGTEAAESVEPINSSELIDDAYDEPLPNSMRLDFIGNNGSDIVVGSNEGTWTVAEPMVPNRFKVLLKGLNPIDLVAWRDAAWYKRIFILVKAPIICILNLTIPVVDVKRPLNNWCQPLNAIHCITVPLFLVFAPKFDIVEANRIIALTICVVLSSPAAVLIIVCADPNRPPRWHYIYAYVGFASAILFIYLIADEVIDLLKTIGLVFNINNATLGLTLLAWGNSIGDLVANLAVARSGSRVMALSACFGGPLLNMLVGIGMAFTIACVRRRSSIKVKFDGTVAILSGFLFASLCSTMIAMVILRFQTRKTYAVYLVILYLMFTIIALLNAFKIIT